MLYIVIATFNGLARTQRLIASLAAIASPQIRIVVVDNGSTDGTVDWVSSLTATTADGQKVPLCPRIIQLIANQSNLGAAGAWNQGIRFALANGAKGILVMGSDTLPQPGAIERMWARIESGIAFVTGTAVAYNAPDQSTAPIDPADTLIAAPDFSCFMFTPAAVEIIGKWDAGVEIQSQYRALVEGKESPAPIMNPWEWGLFDSRYWPGYFEDNDIHTRAKFAGLPCLRDPLAIFRHDCSATVRDNPEIAEINQQTFRRNAELYRAKWGGLPQDLQIPQARPLNVSDEEWQRLCGGVEPIKVSQDEARAAAVQTYGKYGIEASLR